MPAPVSVVLCTRNRGAFIRKAIETIDRQDFPSSALEIIVVDDDSTDDTGAIVQETKTTVPLSYFRQEWGGPAAARNRAIEKALHPLILFVDDDVLVPPHFVAQHEATHQSHGGKIVVRGPIVNVRKPEFPPDFKTSVKYRTWNFLVTCNASVTRESLRALGGFDEDFKGAGYEDTELGWRYRKAGYRMIFNLDAYIFHFKPPRADEVEFNIRHGTNMGRYAAQFYLKHPSLLVALSTKAHLLVRVPHSLKFSGTACRNALEALKEADLPDSRRLALLQQVYQYHYRKGLEQGLSGNAPQKDLSHSS